MDCRGTRLGDNRASTVSPRPNSAPVQSRLLGATGPATDRTRFHHASARRAAVEGGGRPAYAYMNKDDFEIAVGLTAVFAVWLTPHELDQRLSDDDPRREKYLRELREYQLSVGRQVLAVIEKLRAAGE
jgi:hypothetical protein